MNRSEREDLARLARKRARLAITMVAEREKILAADVEDQLCAVHKFDDDAWAEITREAKRAVAKADAQIAEICRQLGIPEDLRPSVSLSWYKRGASASAERRTELRRLAAARIAAAGQAARTAIETKLVEVETELIREGLESAEAITFLNAMPAADELMPRVSIGELEGGQRPERGWEPPAGLTASLLTPSTATDRRRLIIARAIAERPTASDREIARTVGVDHKTVGKVRRGDGGEIPNDVGEIPNDVGEIPTSAPVSPTSDGGGDPA